jgi:ATP diphosphatase
LRTSNAKFTRRFQHIEAKLGSRMGTASLEEMEALWQEAKQAEKQAKVKVED